MDGPVSIHPLQASDREGWESLWLAYLTFYESSLPAARTDMLWERLLDPEHPIRGFGAETGRAPGKLVGIVHFFPHDDTWEERQVCYLQDLFVDPALRGRGIGEKLIRAVEAQAQDCHWQFVYWQTQQHNERARRLYDMVTGGPSGFVVYQLGGR